MAHDKTPQDKRLDTLSEQTEKLKKALVGQMRRTPIVQLACERVGVGRATYYKWRAGDRVFARAADRAKEAGRFFVNDLAVSKLIRMIQDDNLTAIIFWLRYNHPDFATVNRVIHEYEVVTDRMSVEESSVIAHEMSKALAWKKAPKEKPEWLKERLEEELEQAERDAPDRKRREGFEDDSEGAPVAA